MPDKYYYHFHIILNNDIIYVSLSDNVKFNSFEGCCLAAEKWVKSLT